MPRSPSIGIGLVSWKSHDTFRPVLNSHRESGLFSQVEESLLWFQDKSPADESLAQEFGLACDGGPNVGIAGGFTALAERLDTDLILFLENDCPSLASPAELQFQLDRARRLFAEDQCDILRLRHRWETGEGFRYQKYLSYFPVQELHPDFTAHRSLPKAPPSPLTRRLRRLLKPQRAKSLLGRALYLEKFPEEVHPSAIQKISNPNNKKKPTPVTPQSSPIRNSNKDDELYLTDSRFLNWTNQSVLLPRQLFLETLMPFVRENPSSRTSNGFQSPERPLNCPWWREQQFRIAMGLGLFGHNRIDGSWRSNHHSQRSHSQNFPQTEQIK
jgi:hypothetical protein